ncbi:DUF3107 domain-containing protein [Microlunatus panaciterrae]|uniref:ATP-binding protein n=1 Tax=Microlunatus panaciterrae TaxID=400768 RepID=A0ABS2RHU7_9ACTN|nr:DUF3107 domain-containing protein [Microlunatus panaciterrae]MBM7797524.1 hypothetical protein [Microlunatus panaciterrae]
MQEEHVEIKVGIQHVNREIVLETSSTADDIEKALAKALASDGLLTLSDDRGRKVVVPAASIGYLDLGEENARRVGFSGI